METMNTSSSGHGEPKADKPAQPAATRNSSSDAVKGQSVHASRTDRPASIKPTGTQGTISPANKTISPLSTFRRQSAKDRKPSGTVPMSRITKLWLSGILVLLLVTVLLLFILQNTQRTQMTLYFWKVDFPLGIGLLFSAVIGGLIMNVIAGLRIFWSHRHH